MFLFNGISFFYINSKKEDNLTSAKYLHMYAGPMSTHVEPDQMIVVILIDQLL